MIKYGKLKEKTTNLENNRQLNIVYDSGADVFYAQLSNVVCFFR